MKCALGFWSNAFCMYPLKKIRITAQINILTKVNNKLLSEPKLACSSEHITNQL